MAKFSKQRKNLNRHTEVGTRQLRESIQRDGWIGAITVAADGETFDGSNRIEVGADALESAIVVETDGTKPVVVKRTDIPSADDPRAVRLGFTANQIASIDLQYDADALRAVLENDPIAKAIANEDARIRELLKLSFIVPTLDELAAKYGESNPDDFNPVIRIQVKLEVKELFDSLMEQIDGKDDAEKFEKLLSAVNIATIPSDKDE